MSFGEKLKTLEKLAELGGEDRVMDETIPKLFDYATEIPVFDPFGATITMLQQAFS